MVKKFNQDFNKREEVREGDIENIYGRKKFSPRNSREYAESLIKNFKDHYALLGYQEEPPKKISSGIDQTVLFIGSGISVLKPYILENKIPSPGIFITQNCIRTQNVKGLLNDNYSPAWGSYFTNIELIAPPERLYASCNETFDFFEKRLGISPANMLIRINSSDTDLMDLCIQRYGKGILEINSRNQEYYRHKIGVNGVLGRNFNLALRNPDSNNFFDIGNFIIHERHNKKFFVEIGFGTTTILKELYGLDHVQDCMPVIGLTTENKVIKRKFEDAIVTSVVLLREGLQPFGRDNRNRILKQYIRSLSYFRAKTKMGIEELGHIISDFEEREFPDSTQQTFKIILDFLQVFEVKLIAKKKLSSDEQNIKTALYDNLNIYG